MPDGRSDRTGWDALSRRQPAPLKGTEIQPVDLDLRSNGENDWQDERPGDRLKPQHTKTRRDRTEKQLEKAPREGDGSFGDADSARGGGAAPKHQKGR